MYDVACTPLVRAVHEALHARESGERQIGSGMARRTLKMGAARVCVRAARLEEIGSYEDGYACLRGQRLLQNSRGVLRSARRDP